MQLKKLLTKMFTFVELAVQGHICVYTKKTNDVTFYVDVETLIFTFLSYL